jgi:hypothetical protein
LGRSLHRGVPPPAEPPGVHRSGDFEAFTAFGTDKPVGRDIGLTFGTAHLSYSSREV